MKHLLSIAAALTLMAQPAGALTVENTAGSLATLVTDTEVTQLTITGTMDVRDMLFIKDNLLALQSVDMSGVEIVAYDNVELGRLELTQQGEAGALMAYTFMGKPLTQVTLSATLTAIGDGAFAGCSGLTAIELPASLTTLGSYAFSATGITSVVIPAGVTQMGREAFAHCPSLTQATVHAPFTGDATFLDDAALTTVTLGEGVNTIGRETFVGTALQQLNIPATTALGKVGDWAFSGTALTAMAVPASVTAMGDGTFFGASELAQVTLPEAVDAIAPYQFVGTQVPLATLVPEGYTAIGDYAFYNMMQSVDTVFLPASLERIGAYAFAGTTGIKNYVVPTEVVPELGELVWDGVNQPVVNVKTLSNDMSDAFAQAEQWQDFHILRLYLLGDVNNDGRINVGDVVAIIAFIRHQEPATFIESVADINEDSRINVGDAVALRQKIIEHDTNTRVYRIKSRGESYGIATSDALEVGDVIVRGDGTAIVPLRLNNSRAYTALQFDLQLPQGVTLVDEFTAAGERAPRHGAYSMMHDDGTARVLLYSDDCDNLLDSDESVVYLTLQCDGALSDRTIAIDELLLVTDDYESYVGEDCTFALLNPSGVDDIAADAFKIYAQAGKVIIEAPAAATAQIVAMNGTWRTVDVQPGRNEVDLATGIYVVRVAHQVAKVAVR